VTAVAYGNAAIRGQLRRWKSTLAERYRGFDAVYRGDRSTLRGLVDDFVRRGSPTGRRRAFAKLATAFGSGVTLEGLRTAGDAHSDAPPLAVWSLLKPRAAVVVEPRTPSLAQNCIAVNYVLAGWLPYWQGDHVVAHAIGVAEGLWSLEIPDHALGRAMERSGMLPDAIIHDAHHNLLRLRPEQLITRNRKFAVKAGAGGFICEMRFGSDVSYGDNLTVSVFAHTWVAEAMLRADQVLMIDDGIAGMRLSDTWLLPPQLRRLYMGIDATGEAELVTDTWSPGLPAMLSQPAGRA
jgi:hypothetical protein